MRRTLTFTADGDQLFASLDVPGAGQAPRGGLLIVSGGNEIRCGAHRGMAMLARDVAAAGHAVLRFDRRGIGDSEGDNGGYRRSRADIVAAITAFRAAVPGLGPITGFGNCDAAAALLLHQALGLDRLVLANPWTLEDDGVAAASALPPPAAIRARYAARLADPAALVRRFVRGDLNLGRALKGVAALARPAAPIGPDSLAAQLLAALADSDVPTTILLADRDRTAASFSGHWDSPAGAAARANPHVRLARHDSTGHSFAGAAAPWLTAQILTALGDQAAA